MKKILLASCWGAFAGLTAPASAAPSYIPYTTAGAVYSQNFDTLPNPGTVSVNTDNPVTINGITYSLANPFDFAAPSVAAGNTGGLGIAALAGWYGWAELTSKFGATPGDQTTGGDLSFGLTNSVSAGANRALGLLATSTTAGTAFGAKFINQTAATLTEMTLQFTGELWRQSNVPKTVEFYYFIDSTGTSDFTTNHTAFLPALNVTFPTAVADVGGVAVNGTLALNQTSLGLTNQVITNWAPGAALWLVWEMPDSTGKAQGIGIDNLTFSASTTQTVTPVFLAIEASGGNVVISWPTTATGFKLQQSSDISLTNGWSAPSQSVAPTNGLNTVTVPVGGGAQYFRLINQ